MEKHDGGDRIELVPRFAAQGYTRADVQARRRWVEEHAGCCLDQVGAFSLDPETLRGNVENPVGAVQVPLGVAGPLRVRGEHADGVFYLPLATTEGALVRSYERGMVALTRAGGAVARVLADENRVCPVFVLPDVAEAATFVRWIDANGDRIRSEAEATTRHGRLLRIACRTVGRRVFVELTYDTGDAHGMNMIARASERAARWIVEHSAAERYLLMSGAESEKRASGAALAGGKGKRVTAGARLPERLLRSILHTRAEAMVELWQDTVLGHLQAATLGYNGHAANLLTALFIACGQDVANVANSALALTSFEAVGDGDLHASVTLPSLSVATVGGGTALGTAHECLEMLGCAGEGRATKLAEITTAAVLAGELSMAAALASGEFVAAHETYGRNRPVEEGA